MSGDDRKPASDAVPFGSLELYEQATQEIYRRDYGDLVQIRAGQREFLSVRLGREHYAVDLRGILEVTRPSAITPVPFSPPWVLGVMLLRGNIVPIFHVGRMLGLGVDEVGVEPGERVLIVPRKGGRASPGEAAGEGKDSVVGLLVDEVLEVVAVPEEDLGPVPATVTGPRAEFVIGVARKAEKVLGILNQGRLAKAEPGDKALEGA
ncbi:MAG TPA: chemotaxis protein CheW [bacterium]|nr:chemotaxis protein CheW [bacterium]